MPNENIFSELMNRIVTGMEISLMAKATKTAVTIDEYIKTSLLNGVDPDTLEKNLIDDLENNGRLFSEFRSAIKATSNGIITKSRDAALFSEIGIDTKYRWVAVLVNTCPDCMDRHGQVKTWDDWEMEGLPRTGQTVCKDNCKCILLPEETTELAPIQRGGTK